jgi:hypothetical protein
MGRNYSIFNDIKRFGDKRDSPFSPPPMHHIGCMTALNLTWFRASPLPDEEREFFIRGELE